MVGSELREKYKDRIGELKTKNVKDKADKDAEYFAERSEMYEESKKLLSDAKTYIITAVSRVYSSCVTAFGATISIRLVARDDKKRLDSEYKTTQAAVRDEFVQLAREEINKIKEDEISPLETQESALLEQLKEVTNKRREARGKIHDLNKLESELQKPWYKPF